jgi:hypothetical protein
MAMAKLRPNDVIRERADQGRRLLDRQSADPRAVVAVAMPIFSSRPACL